LRGDQAKFVIPAKAPLISASNASKVFDLRCEVRERMIAYVQERYPEAPPRLRADVQDQRSTSKTNALVDGGSSLSDRKTGVA